MNIMPTLKRVIPFPIQAVIWKTLHIRTVLRQRAARNPQTPQEERKIFDLLKDRFEIVFDVGARNELSFYHLKNSCSYHLFEPNVKFVKQLRDQISRLPYHNIVINHFGLSDINADNCVYYEKSQSFIVNPTFKEGDVDTGIRYSVRTLDSYLAEQRIPKIDFLKIDAEGSDYKIIVGGINVIRSNKVSFIQFEYWDGVKKFANILNNFNLYLMMEPVLLRAIKDTIMTKMTTEQKRIDFRKSIIPLDDTLVDLIDNTIIPTGNGGNVLGINKTVKDLDVRSLMFDVTY